MAHNDCGCRPAIDSDDRVVGVVPNRDIACRRVAEGKDSFTPISEVMTSQARCCGPDDDAQEAMQVMTEAQVRGVPVVDEAGCWVGLVSQTDTARKLDDHLGDVVEGVSESTASSSQATQSGRGTSGLLSRQPGHPNPSGRRSRNLALVSWGLSMLIEDGHHIGGNAHLKTDVDVQWQCDHEVSCELLHRAMEAHQQLGRESARPDGEYRARLLAITVPAAAEDRS